MKEIAMTLQITLAPARTPTTTFWGTGHTADTDPTRKGWRCRPVAPGGHCWVVGQKGRKGCASVMLVGERLDVALYLEDPGDVDRAIRAHEAHVLDPRYVEMAPRPYGGDGLAVIRLIEEERRIHLPDA
jgi:hypothetical protein